MFYTQKQRYITYSTDSGFKPFLTLRTANYYCRDRVHGGNLHALILLTTNSTVDSITITILCNKIQIACDY